MALEKARELKLRPKQILSYLRNHEFRSAKNWNGCAGCWTKPNARGMGCLRATTRDGRIASRIGSVATVPEFVPRVRGECTALCQGGRKSSSREGDDGTDHRQFAERPNFGEPIQSCCVICRESRYGLRGQRIGETTHPGPPKLVLISSSQRSVPTTVPASPGTVHQADIRVSDDVEVLPAQWESGTEFFTPIQIVRVDLERNRVRICQLTWTEVWWSPWMLTTMCGTVCHRHC